ncbi:MAG: hypothetical protein ACYC3S_18385 [Chloroflexota bacterium]
MIFRQHEHLYGTTAEQLVAVALNNRKNAQFTPWAVMKKPLAFEEYLNGRWIVEPLRLYDYCLINDGGMALILATAKRARGMEKPLVYISATACATDMTDYYMSKDFYYVSADSLG